MKLRVDFGSLHQAVARMGAKERDFSIHIDTRPMEPIDIELNEGKEIPLAEVETPSGLLAYQGRQILLYIKDHGWNVSKAVQDGAAGKRFHVADCKTLQEMRSRNRYDRYVVTNNLSGEFEITGIDPITRAQVSDIANLKVCINCLKKLNYKGYNSLRGNPKEQIWKPFSIDEFFKTYSSVFKYLPGSDPDDDGQYTEDWPIVSGEYKAASGFRCEACGVDLSAHKNLLHTHHLNGVKSDNCEDNLKALCADCHRKQAHHDHMFVSHDTMQTINRLRREQGVGAGAGAQWDEILELADPAVEGVLLMAQKEGISEPEVGYEIQQDDGEIIAQLELAWPDQKIGIAIAEKDANTATANGWTLWGIERVLDEFEGFKVAVKGEWAWG